MFVDKLAVFRIDSNYYNVASKRSKWKAIAGTGVKCRCCPE